METAVIIGVVVAVATVILFIIITVFVTVLVCMKHNTTSESERRWRSKVCPLRLQCVCVCTGHNSLTELTVVVLHPLTHPWPMCVCVYMGHK